jgi:hypothetical protein
MSLSNLWRSRGVPRWRLHGRRLRPTSTTYSFLFRSRRRVSRDVRHSSYMSTARSGRESVWSTTFLILGLSLPIASSPTTSIAATVCSASVYLDIFLLPIAIPNLENMLPNGCTIRRLWDVLRRRRTLHYIPSHRRSGPARRRNGGLRSSHLLRMQVINISLCLPALWWRINPKCPMHPLPPPFFARNKIGLAALTAGQNSEHAATPETRPTTWPTAAVLGAPAFATPICRASLCVRVRIGSADRSTSDKPRSGLRASDASYVRDALRSPMPAWDRSV